MENENNFLLDTNILVLAVRKSPIWENIKTNYKFDFDDAYLSFVSKAEILSLASQFEWGENKINNLNEALSRIKTIPIDTEELLKAYIQIDLYSQKKLKGIEYPPNFTPRNMGKNDIWIAATAFVIDATLLSTDKDFEHLKDTFIRFEWVEI